MKTLVIYECDLELLNLINDVAQVSLEKLTIIKWYQPVRTFNAEQDKIVKTEDLKGILSALCGDPPQSQNPRKRFENLQKLNFCSTWHTIQVAVERVDDQNDQTMTMTGNRELELMFLGLKGTLCEVHLG